MTTSTFTTSVSRPEPLYKGKPIESLKGFALPGITASRPFTPKERSILNEILGTVPLTSPSRHAVDQYLYELKRFHQFCGYQLWQHTERLGPSALVSFHLPTSPGKPFTSRRRSIPADREHEYREGVYDIIDTQFGQPGEYQIGVRLNPHCASARGPHAHALLPLVRFPQYLKPWARVFPHVPAAVKRQWLPFFFAGLPLERLEIHPRLVEPYLALLGRFFDDIADDPFSLVHVTDEPYDISTDDLNRRGVHYLDRPWRWFDTHRIALFYPDDAGREVLVPEQAYPADYLACCG